MLGKGGKGYTGIQIKKCHNYIRLLAAWNAFDTNIYKVPNLPMAYKHNIYQFLNFHMNKHSALYNVGNLILFSASLLPLCILASFYNEEIGVKV